MQTVIKMPWIWLEPNIDPDRVGALAETLHVDLEGYFIEGHGRVLANLETLIHEVAHAFSLGLELHATGTSDGLALRNQRALEYLEARDAKRHPHDEDIRAQYRNEALVLAAEECLFRDILRDARLWSEIVDDLARDQGCDVEIIAARRSPGRRVLALRLLRFMYDEQILRSLEGLPDARAALMRYGCERPIPS